MNTLSIDITLIKDSPFQHRTYSEESIKELAESINQQGLLQKIKVRPVGDEYELVYGHRRLRALRELDVANVECEVVEFNDNQAEEALLTENLQREDPHFLDMVEVVDTLHKRLTVAEMANRLGVSRKEITQALKMKDLSAKVKKAAREGWIDEPVAKELALFPKAMQDSLLEDGTKVYQDNIGHDDESKAFVITPKEIREERHKSMRLLSEAKFTLSDKPNCIGCVFNTDTEPTLFGTSNGYCTNSKCWDKKEDKWWNKLLKQVAKDHSEFHYYKPSWSWQNESEPDEDGRIVYTLDWGRERELFFEEGDAIKKGIKYISLLVTEDNRDGSIRKGQMLFANKQKIKGGLSENGESRFSIKPIKAEDILAKEQGFEATPYQKKREIVNRRQAKRLVDVTHSFRRSLVQLIAQATSVLTRVEKAMFVYLALHDNLSQGYPIWLDFNGFPRNEEDPFNKWECSGDTIRGWDMSDDSISYSMSPVDDYDIIALIRGSVVAYAGNLKDTKPSVFDPSKDYSSYEINTDLNHDSDLLYYIADALSFDYRAIWVAAKEADDDICRTEENDLLSMLEKENIAFTKKCDMIWGKDWKEDKAQCLLIKKGVLAKSDSAKMVDFDTYKKAARAIGTKVDKEDTIELLYPKVETQVKYLKKWKCEQEKQSEEQPVEAELDIHSEVGF